MTVRSASLVIVTLLIACGGPQKGPSDIPKKWDLFIDEQWTDEPIPWVLDCDFPLSLISDVEEGFEYWDSFVSSDLFYKVDGCISYSDYSGYGEDTRIVFVTIRSTAHIDLKNAKATILAYAWHFVDSGLIISGRILYEPTWFMSSKSLRIGVARHEVGHVLGMNHVPDRSCLMYPFISYSPKPKNACEREKEEFVKRYE